MQSETNARGLNDNQSVTGRIQPLRDCNAAAPLSFNFNSQYDKPKGLHTAVYKALIGGNLRGLP
jgi:hypothetical protein